MTGIRVNTDGRIGKGSGVRVKEGGLRECRKENLCRFFFYSLLTHSTASLICTPVFLHVHLAPLASPSICMCAQVGVGEKVHGIFPQLDGSRSHPTPTHFLSVAPLPLSHVRRES